MRLITDDAMEVHFGLRLLDWATDTITVIIILVLRDLNPTLSELQSKALTIMLQGPGYSCPFRKWLRGYEVSISINGSACKESTDQQLTPTDQKPVNHQ